MAENYISKETNVVTEDEQTKQDTQRIQTLKDYKKRFEPRWYLVEAFWEGFHFTYGTKDKDGNWDRAHVISALQRLNQTTLSDNVEKQIKLKIKTAYKALDLRFPGEDKK